MGVGGLSLLLLCLEAPGVTPAGIFSHVRPSVASPVRVISRCSLPHFCEEVTSSTHVAWSSQQSIQNPKFLPAEGTMSRPQIRQVDRPEIPVAS